jgi:hypothetical protein
MSTATANSIRRRSFGEELDTNCHSDIHNSSNVSMESKDTAISALTEDGLAGLEDDNSSVAMLRRRLDAFGKQSKKHFEKNTCLMVDQNQLVKGPSRPKLPPPPPPPSQTVHRRMDTRPMDRRVGMPRATPIRIIKPKVNSEEVQATNQGYASVAKLSAWLADDPTKTKKAKPIRRGMNVIAKSRAFDKGLADVIIEKSNIQTGLVTQKKEWLQATFSEDSQDDTFTGVLHEKTAKRMATDFKETGSSISVSDKKEWLNNVFKKSDACSAFATKAKSEIITEHDTRNDLSMRAKELWRKRSPPRKSPLRDRMLAASKSTDTGMKKMEVIKSHRPVKPRSPRAAESTISSSVRDVRFTNRSSHSSSRSYTTPFKTNESMDRDRFVAETPAVVRTQQDGSGKPIYRKTPYRSVSVRDQYTMENADAFKKSDLDALCSSFSSNACLDDNHSVSSFSELSFNPDGEDQRDDATVQSESIPPVDSGMSVSDHSTGSGFHAARNLLVQRSRQNGNAVDVVSKVQLRKAKFEKLEKEVRKATNPQGLLKPSWEGANPKEGASSSSYIKKYMADIPQKRSIHELP